jgi:hypothetical protein
LKLEREVLFVRTGIAMMCGVSEERVATLIKDIKLHLKLAGMT